MDRLAEGTAMGLLAMGSVGLWTLRVAVTAKGRKLLGAAVAAVEAVVFALAFTSVTADLHSPVRLGGYAAGVAVGTLLGLLVDEHLAAGSSEVQVVVHDDHELLAERLRALGWPATAHPGTGPEGAVTVVFVAVDDGRLRTLLAAVRELSPDAFWTVRQLRRAHPSTLPAGFTQLRS